MAKELPYFQFEPAEYLTKDVSFLSFAAQGAFINLCCYYWQRLGSLSLEQARRRIKQDNLIDELIDEGIIRVKEGTLVIAFLDRQKEEAIARHERAKANGRRGGKAKAEQNSSQAKDLLEQEESKNVAKRKEKKIKEKKIYRSFKHLSLTEEENEKLLSKYSQEQIDSILDSIENYKGNKNYSSLYLTATKWLKKEHGTKQKTTWV